MVLRNDFENTNLYEACVFTNLKLSGLSLNYVIFFILFLVFIIYKFIFIYSKLKMFVI